MNDGSVANRAIRSDIGPEIICEVDDASILHICPFAYPDRINISAKDGSVENTGVAAQADITKNRRIGRHESCLGDLWFSVEKPLEAVFGIHEWAALISVGGSFLK
jgi:hypothetical protein